MITLPKNIDWGGVINSGVELFKNQVLKRTGPVSVAQKANDYTPVENKTPSWVVPALVVVGALLLLKGRR